MKIMNGIIPTGNRNPVLWIHVLPAFDHSSDENISIQPLASQMSETGDTEFSDIFRLTSNSVSQSEK